MFVQLPFLLSSQDVESTYNESLSTTSSAREFAVCAR
jgi:hypothetical protein